MRTCYWNGYKEEGLAGREGGREGERKREREKNQR